MRLVITLVLLVASYVVAEDVVVPLCDAQGSWGKEFVKKLYAAHPPPTRSPYAPDACRRYFAGDDMRMFWTINNELECRATCGTVLYIPLAYCAVAGGLLGAAEICINKVMEATLCYSPWVTRDASGCKEVICSV